MKSIVGQNTVPITNVRYFASPQSVDRMNEMNNASVKSVTAVDADAPINYQPGKMTEMASEDNEEPRFLEQV